MQLSKNFLAFTALLGLMGCLLLSYTLYQENQSHSIVRERFKGILSVTENLVDKNNTIINHYLHERAKWCSHPIDTLVPDIHDAYLQFTSSEATDASRLEYKAALVRLSRKNGDMNKLLPSLLEMNAPTHFTADNSLHNQYWKAQAGLARQAALNDNLARLNCNNAVISPESIFVIPTSHSTRSGEDFEAYIYLASIIEANMKVFINDNKVPQYRNGIHFKAKRNPDKKTKASVKFVWNDPDTLKERELDAEFEY